MFGIDDSPLKLSQHLQPPVTTYIQSAAYGQILAPYDPTRVWLGITGSAIGVNPTTLPGNVSGGFLINTGNGQGNFILTYWHDGPMVTSQWVLTFGATPNVVVVSQSLVDPGELRSQFPPQPIRQPQQITTAPGVNGNRGLLDYWRNIVAQFGARK